MKAKITAQFSVTHLTDDDYRRFHQGLHPDNRSGKSPRLARSVKYTNCATVQSTKTYC